MGREVRRGRPAVLAVDGGNSKADALLIDRSGNILSAARRVAPSNVAHADGFVDALRDVIRAAEASAGINPARGPGAEVGVYCLAGADSPADERRIGRALARRAWTGRNIVRNDTFAVLRAGTDRGWGVAMVCGAGMNCVGVSPAGRVVRFASLGPLSGDLAAGGEWMGLAALGAAIRGRDGRGPRTALEQAVPHHFGLDQPEAVMRAIHRGRLSQDRLVELPPAVFDAASSGDPVARGILDRLADEVVVTVAATMRRLRVTMTDVDVVLGGGVFLGRDEAFVARVRAGIEAEAPRANVIRLSVPPVLGAALIGLDEIDASARASVRLRESIGHASLRPTRRPRRQASREASSLEV